MIETATTTLTVAELDRRLRAADPAAILVPSRLLRRIIKHDRLMAGVGLQVPHRKCYAISRDALLAFADRDELGIELDRDLPPTVVLLPRPDPESLATKPAGPVLTKFWRLLFHAAVHRAIAARHLKAADIRTRVRRIGHAAFDEIRTVLRQDRFLLPPQDDATVYEEFAALFLELTYFASPLLRHYFPAIDEFARVDRLLAADVDGPALFATTRPAGAPDPEVTFDLLDRCDPAEAAAANDCARTVLPSESQRLTALAGRAAVAGNDVRAALRHMQAARTAPGKQVHAARAAAEAELQRLVKRLRPALGLTAIEAAAWRQALPALLVPASQGLWPPGARLLYDLQKICVDHERPVSAPHPAEWVYSRFTRPFVQPLPDMPVVLAVKHLRRAAGRLTALRVGEPERHALGTLLNAALCRAEARLRDRFRPRIIETLAAVGLTPANYPERVSRDKLVEELLDLVATRGFLSQPDLRDALSRNQLKLPDLTGPEESFGGGPLLRRLQHHVRRAWTGVREFFGGDPLLRANRELAVRMPGVYRRGEIYLRWLQRLSALAFGTRSGRWLTRNFFLPFGGAFLAIEGPLQVGHELVHLYHYILRLLGLRPSLAATISGAVARTVGAAAGAGTLAVGVGAAGALAWAVARAPELVFQHGPFPLAPWPALLLGGVYFWLLLHVPTVRRTTMQVLGVVGRVVQFALLDAPGAILRWPTLRAVLESRTVRFLARFTLKPLLPAAITWFYVADWKFGARYAAIGGALVYVATMLFLTTRLSRELEELTADWAVRRWEYLRNFLPGLFRMIADAFKRLLEAIDRGLYAVDEWLRFRGGETWLTHGFKAVAGLAWGAVAYVVRLLLILFIEPQVNPIKHFPVVTISHKFLLPMVFPLTGLLERKFGIEPGWAGTIAFLTVGKIPGLFGFLVWELKENWRLYRANRPLDLQPARIGHHGETMPRLLRPGFHSGTLPKLYAKLRRAERRALKTGEWGTARRHIETLHHAEEAIRRFAERELLAYVNATPAWRATPLRLACVEAGSNQVRIELACPAAGDGRLKVTFEEQSGWLVAGTTDPAWQIPDEQAAVLRLALTGFFKVGGADLLNADIEEVLGQPPQPYDVTEAGLVAWPSEDAEVIYDLTAAPTIAPRVVAGTPPEMPVASADRLLFRRRPVPWAGWVAAWDMASSGSNGKAAY
jgi:hypothetical protein